MNLTFTLPPRVLPLLVPADAAVETTWVVCFAHRPRVAINGVATLGSVAGWHPMIPFDGQDAAEAWAERFERAIDGPDTELHWYPADDDGVGLELFVVIDGEETQTDVAIYPLTALADPAPAERTTA
ncbi:hypothetical protein HNP84_000246 [Thermocatellispora tengchongensis]|uniref:Uncharacterized protein n=1 Tax=Thermocatellispora tengchongensis TaxID=1073253 RepID=A0A840NSK5_9ACTN|nr:hypothetical protein [Thermocatellispora tengchongensis]MBB5130558.1 hypothetical protein [Thermocatellispora tengchongensis]